MAAGSSRPSLGPPISSVGCSGPCRRVTSSFILSILLGLAFGLPSVANGVEVKARCTVVHSEVVGSAALVMLVHPRHRRHRSLSFVGQIWRGDLW
jgi:hypothetical protein